MTRAGDISLCKGCRAPLYVAVAGGVTYVVCPSCDQQRGRRTLIEVEADLLEATAERKGPVTPSRYLWLCDRIDALLDERSQITRAVAA